MNIALFGGAFDPPHLGHAQVVSSLLQEQIAEEVWYLPVKNHHFAKQMSSVEKRIEMLELVVGNQTAVKIELYETQQEGVNYTYRTMMALQQQYPEHTFSFVIGSDNLAGYHRWLEKHPLLLDLPFYVYPREGFLFEPLYPNMTPLAGMETVTVSSTDIRARVQAGESISGLVLPEVERYIEKHQLYR